MKKIAGIFLIALAIFAAPHAYAQQQPVNGAIPEMPDPIKELVNQGAQARFIGKDMGLDGWITIKGGQEQYFYVLPDRSGFLTGVLFDNHGKNVTIDQVKRLQSQGDTVLDALADTYQDATTPAGQKKEKEFQSPSERMFSDIENSNWTPLGESGAPIMYAFIDPQCPHCHAFIDDLRKDYLMKGKVQLRMIPVGFKDETIAQAAYLLAAPDPEDRWYRHMDGDKTALPAKAEINQQGVQRNLAIMQSWKFDVTPVVVYRGKDGKVKIVKGRPTDIPALIADLGARS